MSIIAVYNLTPNDLDRLFWSASTSKIFKVTEVAKRYRDFEPYNVIVETDLEISEFKETILLKFDHPAKVTVAEMI